MSRSRNLRSLIFTLGLSATLVGIPLPASSNDSIDEAPALKVMKEELDRSYAALKKEDPPAYFIAYRLYDEESAEVSADRGSIIGVTPYQRDRHACVEVRVGDYDLDSSHRIVNDDHASAENTLGAFGVVPFSDDKTLQNTFWLETEKEYRTAAQRFGRVIGQHGLKSEDDVCADFSHESPTVKVNKVKWDDSIDLEPYKQEAKLLSKIFSEYPEIEYTWTHFKIERTTRYLVNSEGSASDAKKVHVSFSTAASTTANDGEKLSRSEVFYFDDPKELEQLKPKFEKLVRDVASSVVALRQAPLADPYCGPVVLEGPAAAVLFHEVLGHRLEASRHRDSTDGKTFAKMLNQKILPPFISVYDKPSVKQLNGVELNGAYDIDDDGVPAQDVTLVKDGQLKSFLMGRAPTPTSDKSNGHGRCSPGYDPVSRMANLIVESSKTCPENDLRGHLIAEAKKQGKQYGLIIEEVRGGETNTSSYHAQVFQVRPSLVRRVWVDGRPDDFVRGVRVIGTPMAALQRIIETSDKTEVMNGFCGAESGWVAQANCAPSLLLDSLEIERETPDKGIARILPPPPAEGATATATTPKEMIKNVITK